MVAERYEGPGKRTQWLRARLLNMVDEIFVRACRESRRGVFYSANRVHKSAGLASG